MFPESRSWNRGHLHNYYEVYIDAPIGDLIDRDSKGLYLQHARGEITGIAGMDLEFPVPEHPDLVIKNDGAEEELIAHAGAIAQQMLTADYS
jgi:adenylylsulfate kinase